MPSEQEMRLHRCCFTGHRQKKLSSSPEEVKQWLSDQIMNAIDDGYVTFITGMAMGVDIWAGEIVTKLRESDPRLHLIASVPWPGFSARWNAEWKNSYESLLKKADLVKYISKRYDPSIFTKRNLWMVDHCNRVIAYYTGEDGGTKDMILYAQEKGIETVVGLDEQLPEQKAVSEVPEKPSRQYPLNLIDALMNCEAYQSARQVTEKDIPPDFDERLRKAASAIKDDRAYDFLILRYRDSCTLQMIAEKENLSRERIRQLLEKYIKRLRHPDILRFLDCGIENIPERTSKTILDRLNAVNR